LSKVGANASVHRVVTQLTEILSDRSMDQNGELTALTRYQARQILAGNTQHLRLGKYLILDELGAGGMGKVYKAYNPVLGRIEAIKIVSSTIMDGSPVGLARFAQEAKFLARLEHPFITTIYDSGTIRDTPFITMAYVPGRNLQRVVRDAKDANETLSIVWVLKAIKDLASALEYAHSKGIVHRDVKPNNIMLADSGQVCLLDLGLARMLRDDQEHTRPRLTDPTKRGMGTPEVMPPEQWASPSEVGPTSDIYSLGCTLFYLLSSTMPFKANSPTDYMHAHMNADRPDLSERDPNIPRPLARLVQKMMAIDPKDRFANCKELVESLNAIDLPTPKPIVLPQAPSARPRRALPIWLSILAMFVIASSATIYYRSRRLDYDKQV
jgi:serine/threonine-protein kinase